MSLEARGVCPSHAMYPADDGQADPVGGQARETAFRKEEKRFQLHKDQAVRTK